MVCYKPVKSGLPSIDAISSDARRQSGCHFLDLKWPQRKLRCRAALPTLKSKIIRAGSWTILAYGFTQGTRLLSSLILTRLLVPEVFGVMAIVNIVSIALALLSDIGLAQVGVRSERGDDRRFLDTLWILQIVRGLAIWAVAALAALALVAVRHAGLTAADSVYAHPDLPPAIAAMGATALFAGLESTQIVSARRHMNLGAISRLEIVANFVSVTVTVGWAWFDRSIWALLGGWIVGSTFRAAASHLVLPGPCNRPAWDLAAVSEIMGFGKWLVASSTLTLIVTSGDRLILSGLLSSQQLGVYSIAYLIVNAAQQGLSRLAAFVAFPYLSAVVRDRPTTLVDSYYRLRYPLDLAALGMTGFLFAAGQAVIGLLYDTRYAGAGDMIAILGLVLIAARYEVAEQVFLSLGKPRLLALSNAVRGATLFAAIPMGFFWAGLGGAIWGIVLAGWLPSLLTLYLSRRHGIFALRRELVVLYALPLGYVLGAIFAAAWEHWRAML